MNHIISSILIKVTNCCDLLNNFGNMSSDISTYVLPPLIRCRQSRLRFATMALDIPLSAQKPKAATYAYTYLDVCQAAKRGNLHMLKLALFGEGFNLNTRDKVSNL